MAKVEDEQKSAGKALRQLIRSEDNRKRLRKLLELEVEPALPTSVATLLESIDQAKQETTIPRSKRAKIGRRLPRRT